MTTPNITEVINGYILEWPEHKLLAKATRIRTPSDGQVKGELEIQRNVNGTINYLLVPTQFNFSSEPTRAKFAKQLTEKLDVKLEWKEIFDCISETVQRLARAGDSCIEVYPQETVTLPQQLVGNIIYKGVQNIIFGEKGVNKSTLAYLLGICVSLPWPENPLGLEVPTESVKTLVLDWETDKPIFEYCISRLQKGMQFPYCSLYYRRCNLPLADDIEPIQKHIEASRAKLLVIDSLGAAAGGEHGELKGAESALLFNSALRKLDITSLIVGQTKKGDDEKKKTIFGSTYFTYYARNIFELCAGEDDFSDTQHLGLFHRECNLGRKTPPLGLRLTYTPESIDIEREPVSIAEFVHKVSVSKQILETLKEGAMTAKELQEHLDVSRGSIDMALKRLRQHKQITDTGGKKWGLLSV